MAAEYNRQKFAAICGSEANLRSFALKKKTQIYANVCGWVANVLNDQSAISARREGIPALFLFHPRTGTGAQWR